MGGTQQTRTSGLEMVLLLVPAVPVNPIFLALHTSTSPTGVVRRSALLFSTSPVQGVGVRGREPILLVRRLRLCHGNFPWDF